MAFLSYIRTRWQDFASVVLILGYHDLVVAATGIAFVVAFPTTLGDAPAGTTFPWWRDDGRALGPDGTVMLVAAAAGALGAILHAMHFTVHVAKDKHDWRWAPWHALQPFRGAILGLLVYLGSRAGLAIVSGGAETDPSPYVIGFASLTAGLFANSTIEALKDKYPSFDPRKDENAGGTK